MNDLLAKLKGRKSYLAAAGLAGLALYQFSAGNMEQSVQTFLAALAVAGLRHAVTPLPPAPPPPQDPPFVL